MVEIGTVPDAARLVLQCAPADAEALAGARLRLPAAMLRAERFGSWHALHLAPDEWLLVGPPGERDGMIAHFAAVADRPHSLVDVGARSVGVTIDGADAALLLNAGCPLDLSDAAFPVSACTRTLFGKASVLLWRTGATAWRLEYWRSFAGYVTGYLDQAVRDLEGEAA